MWPKMLMELLPHLARVVPMWEKFINSRQASEKAAESALNALAEEVRGDLAQVTAAHAGLYRQLQEQSAQIAALAEETRLARRAAEGAEVAARLPDSELQGMTIWAKRVFGALIVVAILLVLSIVLQVALRQP